MNKLPFLAFSILLLISVGAQNAFGSLIGDTVTVEFPSLGQQTDVVVNDLANPEFIFNVVFDVGTISVNVESEEIWIEYESFLDGTLTLQAFDFWLTDLDWIENGQVVPGVIQDVTCTQMAQTPINFGPITIINNEIHIPLASVVINDQFETVGLHCEIDVLHEGEQIIGGEIIPIESISLLVAGAQVFSWMIPVTLSVLGIGLFLVFRKSQN